MRKMNLNILRASLALCTLSMAQFAFASPLIPSIQDRFDASMAEAYAPAEVESDPMVDDGPGAYVDLGHGWSYKAGRTPYASQAHEDGSMTVTPMNHPEKRLEVSAPDAGGNFLVRQVGAHGQWLNCHTDPVSHTTNCN